MRLFIGLNLPKKQKMRIHRAARPLRDDDLPVRWVEPENLHVTLKFLGEVREDRVPAIEAAMSDIGSSTRPFTADLGGFGAFPTVRRPRILWLGLEATPELRCLKQDLEWSLGDLGFEVETRAFHPHVTLGRTKKNHGAGVFRGLDRRFADIDFEDTLKVHTVDLVRSRLSKDGPRYSVVAGARLAAA